MTVRAARRRRLSRRCSPRRLGVYYGYAEPGELEAAGAVTTVQTVAELSERLLHWNEA